MEIALVGNQNSGKTTLFNYLTGSNQKVGNWPGVTIEQKIGKIKNTNLDLIDLPGIYSLSPYTKEEEVSRKFIMEEHPDIIINIIDSTSIERSLYLTTQLLELDAKVIIVLNMEDVLAKKGIKIDEKKLEKLLHTTVIKISALKNTGIDELITKLEKMSLLDNYHLHIYEEDIENAISTFSKNIDLHPRFVSVKLLESDQLVSDYQTEEIKKINQQLIKKYQMDLEEVIANQRYQFIEKIKKEVAIVLHQKETMTDKLDKIFLNKWLAIPIFIVIMLLMYFLAVGVVGNKTVDLVENLVSNFAKLVAINLEKLGASNWMVSLISDGIIVGVGAVLNFIPQLIILFICISILETSGYMSRIAFFLDCLFKKIGLSGKSLIPFIIGSGCSVPGVMGARMIEDDNERDMTIILTPFVPCSAKLPIITLFVGYFFPNNSGLISASLYFLAIIIIIICAIIMKKFIYLSNNSAFIFELPEYKLPSVKYVTTSVFEKTLSFIKRAGTIILFCSVIVWFLVSFTWKAEYIENNYQTLEGYDLVSIATSKGILFDDDTKVKFSFNDNDELMVSFGSLKGNGGYEYTKYYDVEGINKDILLKSTNNDSDSRKELIVKNDGKKIIFAYSLTIEHSILASIGKLISWAFYPVIGENNWAASVSALQGLVAKEQVVGSMAVIAGATEETSDGNIIFTSQIFSGFTALSAYSFMIFNLFSAPCFGAIAVMAKELGSKKKMLKAILFQTGIAWLISSLFFGIGTLIGGIF